MPGPYPLKDHFRETSLFSRRIGIAFFFIFLLFSSLIGRLVYLQIIKHDLYTTLSKNNRITLKPIAPKRGLIFDRHGQLLAENKPRFYLEITPANVANMDHTLASLSKILTLRPRDLKQFSRQRRTHSRYHPIPLKKRLSEEEVARFLLEKHRFPGVDINARLERFYPMGQYFSHVCGYLSAIDPSQLRQLDQSVYRNTFCIGKSGLEGYCESELHGLPGYEQIEVDARGRRVRTIKTHAPTGGDDLYLTLDAKLQKAAFDALGDRKGAIVVIVPDTGEILAMISKPAFDPNQFIQGISSKDYQRLIARQDKPLFNRASAGTYPPGSTVKPIIALQALDEGELSMRTRVYDPGWYTLPGSTRKFRDWKKTGHGSLTVAQAIPQSCTTFFFRLAHQLGINTLHRYLSTFGLGSRLALPLHANRSGLVPSPAWKRQTQDQSWYPGETLNVGIGQGSLLVTPLQMAHVASTLATHGARWAPQLIYQRKTHDKIIPFMPTSLESVTLKHPIFWDKMRAMMESTVTHRKGLAHKISRDLTYSLAAKTGTSQVFTLDKARHYQADKLPVHLRDHVWFIGYAPSKAPEIAIAVIIENHSGHTAASVIARKVLDAYFQP